MAGGVPCISARADTPAGPLAFTGAADRERRDLASRLRLAVLGKFFRNPEQALAAVHLGHVHDGYMVNLFADNIKLRGRAARIVAAVAGCDQETAVQALEKTDGQVKPAILLAAGAADMKTAQELLDGTGRRLRPALSKLEALEGSRPKG